MGEGAFQAHIPMGGNGRGVSDPLIHLPGAGCSRDMQGGYGLWTGQAAGAHEAEPAP